MTTSAPLRDNSSAIPNPSVTSQTSLQKSNSILKKQLEMKFNSTNSAPTKLDVAILEDPNATTVEYGNKSNSMLRNYNYSVATTGKIPQRADSTRSGKSKLSLDNQVARTGRPLSIIATNVNPPTNVNSQQQLPPQPTSSPPHATLQHQTSTLSRTTPQQSNIHTPGNNSTAVIMEIDPVAGRPLQPSTAQFPVYKNDPFRGPNGSGGEYGTIKDAINETAKHIKENKGNVPNGQVEDLEPVVDSIQASTVINSLPPINELLNSSEKQLKALSPTQVNILLLYLSRIGDHKLITRVVASTQIDVNASDDQGRTALHFAAMGGHINCIKVLVQQGSLLDTPDGSGRTPLHWSCYFGRIEAVKQLVKLGAKLSEIDYQDQSPLHCSVYSESAEVLKFLLTLPTNQILPLLNASDANDMTPVLLAASLGHTVHVSLLLSKNVDKKCVDKEGKGIMHYAVLNKHVRLLKMLMGRCPEMVQAPDGMGRAPLHLACAEGNIAAVERLTSVGNVDINKKDDTNKTPLHWAAVCGKAACVKLLIERRTSLNEQDVHGATALHYAAQKNYLDIIHILLRKGAYITTSDKGGRHPLIWGAVEGNIEAIKMLINAGADPNTKDHSGLTALHAAAFAGHTAVLIYLIRSGADVNTFDNDKHHTPLFRSVIMGHEETTVALLSESADVSVSDTDGKTVLHWACCNGYLGISHILVNNGADLNAADNKGTTPLQEAAFVGYVDVLAYLISRGADVNGKDHNGCTALHWAAVSGHVDCVQILLDNGADVNARDKSEDQDTPLDYAQLNNHREVSLLLIDRGGMTYSEIAKLSGNKIWMWWQAARSRKIGSSHKRTKSHSSYESNAAKDAKDLSHSSTSYPLKGPVSRRTSRASQSSASFSHRDSFNNADDGNDFFSSSFAQTAPLQKQNSSSSNGSLTSRLPSNAALNPSSSNVTPPASFRSRRITVASSASTNSQSSSNQDSAPVNTLTNKPSRNSIIPKRTLSLTALSEQEHSDEVVNEGTGETQDGSGEKRSQSLSSDPATTSNTNAISNPTAATSVITTPVPLHKNNISVSMDTGVALGLGRQRMNLPTANTAAASAIATSTLTRRMNPSSVTAGAANTSVGISMPMTIGERQQSDSDELKNQLNEVRRKLDTLEKLNVMLLEQIMGGDAVLKGLRDGQGQGSSTAIMAPSGNATIATGQRRKTDDRPAYRPSSLQFITIPNATKIGSGLTASLENFIQSTTDLSAKPPRLPQRVQSIRDKRESLPKEIRDQLNTHSSINFLNLPTGPASQNQQSQQVAGISNKLQRVQSVKESKPNRESRDVGREIHRVMSVKETHKKERSGGGDRDREILEAYTNRNKDGSHGMTGSNRDREREVKEMKEFEEIKEMLQNERRKSWGSVNEEHKRWTIRGGKRDKSGAL